MRENGSRVTPSPPPPAPRPLTPRAARRAWTEPAVRLWWLMAVAVAVVILAYAADRLWARHVENRLVATGAAVTAKVVGTNLHATPGQTADAGEPASVAIEWDGRPMRLNGVLTQSTRIGATLAIRVDPSDPTLWTDRTAATPLGHALFVGLLLLPIVPALAAVAAVRRRAVARAWQLGPAAVAVVSDRRQTPVAPLSYAVRCSLRDGGDRRLFTVYVPRGGRPPAKGDDLWLVLPIGRGRPVAATWFS